MSNDIKFYLIHKGVDNTITTAINKITKKFLFGNTIPTKNSSILSQCIKIKKDDISSNISKYDFTKCLEC